MRCETLKREVETLKLGNHIACIYKDKSEQFSIVIPFILTGLKNNEKCIYIADENTKQEITDAFKDVPIEEYIDSNQLELLTKEEAYLKDGSFDPDKMIELLNHLEKKALKNGYNGLRVTGEMTWIFTKLPGVEKLIEYEAKLNNFSPKSKSIALCQYNEKKFQPEILLDVLHTHPVLIIYDTLYENPRYLPPDEFFARIKGKVHWNTYEKARNNIIEKKKTEEKIKKYERERALILDSMSEIVAYYDKDKKIKWVNKAGADLAGAPPEALVGEYCYKVWHKRDMPCEHCPVYKAWDAAVYQEGELTMADQSVWRVKGDPVFHHDHIIGVVVVARDITEQKRAEEEKNRLLHELGERVRELSCLYGIDEIVRREDATIDDILEEVVHLIQASWQYPEIAGSCITVEGTEYKTGSFQKTQWMQQADIIIHNKKAGAVYVCYTDEPPTEEPFSEEEEKLLIFIAKRLGESIERKKAEITLKRAEKKFRDLFEHASDAIFIYDLKKHFLDVNKTALKQLGYTKEEFLQLTPEDINPPEYAALASERIKELQQKGHLFFETVHITKDGKKIPIEVSSKLIEYQGKKAALSIARDVTERREAEKALRESELRYRTLFESAPLDVGLSTVDGQVLTYNDTMCQMTGYSGEELERINLLDIYVNPQERALLLEQVQKDGFVRDFEVQLKRKDHTVYWASLNVTLLHLGSEDVFLTIARDITDYKKAEKALRQSEEKYRELVENLNEIIYAVDNTGVVTYVSPAVQSFIEYTPSEAVGRHFSEFIYEEDLLRLEESFQKILSGNTVTNEYRVVSKSGGIRWMSTSSRPVITKGRITGVQGVLTDITERKRAEEVLREREEQYRTTIDSMGDAIHVVDDTLRVILVNKAFEKWSERLGLTTDIVGKTPFEVFPFLSDSVRHQYHQVLSTGKTLITEERTKIGGTEFVTETRKIPVLEEGKVCRIVTVVHDITERKKAEEQIKASLKEKEVLLREIHHRVKNNLQVISSLLNLQFEYSRDETYAEILKESQNRIRAMALVHEKLYQSENLADIHFEEYITSLVYGLMRSYGVTPEEIMTRIEVEDVSLGIDAAIPCGLIINELVSNSLKHAFPDGKGEITVRARSADGTIQLTVADNGIGIPDKDFRTAKTLGLDLVTTLAEKQLDGEIILNRTKGTTFTITFRK